jgi:hypothetical protein
MRCDQNGDTVMLESDEICFIWGLKREREPDYPCAVLVRTVDRYVPEIRPIQQSTRSRKSNHPSRLGGPRPRRNVRAARGVGGF